MEPPPISGLGRRIPLYLVQEPLGHSGTQETHSSVQAGLGPLLPPVATIRTSCSPPTWGRSPSSWAGSGSAASILTF